MMMGLCPASRLAIMRAAKGEGKAPQAAGSVLLLHIGYGTVIFLTGGQP
ncbi:MAG TPA: hypothetical protein PKV55_11065 [Nitrospira sp.]|jgi:hypothetical protein|nr:hypothetical protein [Nitrospira sp.]MCC7472313.1 hypothetical protein [Candidatus Nomurabacteria bacterium]MBS0158282.1 hypothetical protein [Nitrospira sp.]MBS0164405.1 hypothetical protein [Nitrospira sp.]MBS0173453.1 hypothetical protein [Nitrospira sp.]